jgi:DNA-binding XRE family transcriptional regulator
MSVKAKNRLETFTLSHAEASAITKKRRPDLAHADAHPSTAYALAVNLRSFRTAKGWTQQKLAKKAGLSLRNVHGMENQAMGINPTLETVDALALALHVRVLDLLRPPKGAEIHV